MALRSRFLLLGFATLLTLVIVPALYAIFVENFGMKPVQLEPTEA